MASKSTENVRPDFVRVLTGIRPGAARCPIFLAGTASGFPTGFVRSGGDLEAAAKGALGGAIVGGIGAAFGDAGAVQC